jgi:hypothetical protein
MPTGLDYLCYAGMGYVGLMITNRTIKILFIMFNKKFRGIHLGLMEKYELLESSNDELKKKLFDTRCKERSD